jgi:hypothetical protein
MYPVSLGLSCAHFPSMQARVMLTKMQRFVALGPGWTQTISEQVLLPDLRVEPRSAQIAKCPPN